MSRKSVTFGPNIPSDKEQKTSKEVQKLSDEEKKMHNELSRVIDNTIKKDYQNEKTIDYLNSLRSKSSDLLKRCKLILPENANLPIVIYFIIFVIKKYHTGFNGYWNWKSNSGKKRSILLYCLDYLFGINEDKKVILNQMFYYTNDQLCNRNKRYSIEKWDKPKTCSATDIILLIFSKDKNLCAKIVNNEYVANYRYNISQKVRTLRSDITMGGLLDLSKENDNRDSSVFEFMTNIFDNDENNIGNTVEDNDVEIIDGGNTGVEKTVETIDETNDGETIDETNVVETNVVKNTAVENNAVENTAVENTAVENNDGNTHVELTVEINDKNHLMNSQILTTCFILASVLIPIIFK